MKTILCPNYLKPKVLSDLLNKDSVLFDTRILPMETYVFPNLERINNVVYLLMAKKALSNCDLKIYKDMIQYPSFIKEVLDFTKTCVLYHMDFDKLPESNDQEKECKTMLNALKDLPLVEYQRRDVLSVNTENVECVDSFVSSLFDAKLKEQFSILSLKTENKIKQLKNALNPRQEIEAVAQEIVKNDNAKDCILILSDYDNQIEVVKQVLSRYNIPATFTKEVTLPAVCIQYRLLVEFMLEPNIEHFTKCLYHNCLNIKFNLDEIDFIFNHYLSLDDLNTPILFDLKTLNKSEITDLTKLAESVYDKCSKLNLDSYLDLSYIDILTKAYDSIIDNEDIASVNAIASLLNDAIPYVSNKEDIDIVVYAVTMTETITSSFYEDGVIVTSLNKPVYPRKKAYVLQCTSKAYPGFGNMDGLFDEDYIAKCQINPLNERYDLYLKQLEWVHHSAIDITYSYYTNDYVGKSFECAFEIEQLTQDCPKSPWTFISINKNQRKDESLRYGKEIFFKNDILRGSVSAFEKYFNCPYSYFIKYGLRVVKPQKTELIANTIGTIQHAIMENLVNDYHKDYFKQDVELFKQIAKPFFDDLKQLYPKHKDYCDLILEKMVNNLKTSFVFLEDMELNTRFTPIFPEKDFDTYYPNITVPVQIMGTIDRIDMNNNYYRILDYKSSSKSLSEDKIRTGLQLQLLTYMIMANTLTEVQGKELVGSYYYSLKNEKIDMPAATIAWKGITTYITDPEIIDNSGLDKKDDREQSVFAQFMKNHRLQGTTINTKDIGLDDGDHIASTKPFTLENIIECENMIYETLYEKLIQGEIEIRPVEHACEYCDFKPICLNHKPVLKPSELEIIYDGDLKGGN